MEMMGSTIVCGIGDRRSKHQATSMTGEGFKILAIGPDVTKYGER